MKLFPDGTFSISNKKLHEIVDPIVAKYGFTPDEKEKEEWVCYFDTYKIEEGLEYGLEDGIVMKLVIPNEYNWETFLTSRITLNKIDLYTNPKEFDDGSAEQDVINFIKAINAAQIEVNEALVDCNKQIEEKIDSLIKEFENK